MKRLFMKGAMLFVFLSILPLLAPARVFSQDTQKKEIEVDWKGSWYPAEILEQDGDKYFIHYLGYDSSWDEWVTGDRIREKGGIQEEKVEPQEEKTDPQEEKVKLQKETVKSDKTIPCNNDILVALRKILKAKDIKALSQHLADVVEFLDPADEPAVKKVTKEQILSALKDKKARKVGGYDDLKILFFDSVNQKSKQPDTEIGDGGENGCEGHSDSVFYGHTIGLKLTPTNWLISFIGPRPY